MVAKKWVLAVAVAVLAGCSETGVYSVDEDISEQGSAIVVPAGVEEVRGEIGSLAKEMGLVVAGETEDSMDLSSSVSAATVTVRKAGETSTRVTVMPDTMVTGRKGAEPHAADPDAILELKKELVKRLEGRYGVKASRTGDPAFLKPEKKGGANDK